MRRRRRLSVTNQRITSPLFHPQTGIKSRPHFSEHTNGEGKQTLAPPMRSHDSQNTDCHSLSPEACWRHTADTQSAPSWWVRRSLTPPLPPAPSAAGGTPSERLTTLRFHLQPREMRAGWCWRSLEATLWTVCWIDSAVAFPSENDEKEKKMKKNERKTNLKQEWLLVF